MSDAPITDKRPCEGCGVMLSPEEATTEDPFLVEIRPDLDPTCWLCEACAHERARDIRPTP